MCCRRAASIKLVCVIVRCAARRKCAQFSAKTARISANFCNVFERDASTLLAKLAEKHVTCLVQRRKHHDSVFVVVSHVCRAFRADLRGLFRRKPRDFSLISTENRSATHAQRLQNMRTINRRSTAIAAIAHGAWCDCAVRCTPKMRAIFRRKPRGCR